MVDALRRTGTASGERSDRNGMDMTSPLIFPPLHQNLYAPESPTVLPADVTRSHGQEGAMPAEIVAHVLRLPG